MLLIARSSQLSFAVALLAIGACSSTPDGDASTPLQQGTLTIQHGNDVYATDCSGRRALRDAQGNPTLTPQTELGMLGAPTSLELSIDFRAN
jgi:hypothetical protein